MSTVRARECLRRGQRRRIVSRRLQFDEVRIIVVQC